MKIKEKTKREKGPRGSKVSSQVELKKKEKHPGAKMQKQMHPGVRHDEENKKS